MTERTDPFAALRRLVLDAIERKAPGLGSAEIADEVLAAARVEFGGERIYFPRREVLDPAWIEAELEKPGVTVRSLSRRLGVRRSTIQRNRRRENQ